MKQREPYQFKNDFERVFVFLSTVFCLAVLIWYGGRALYWSDMTDGIRQRMVINRIEKGNYYQADKLLYGNRHFTFPRKTDREIQDLIDLLRNCKEENYESAYKYAEKITGNYLPEELVPLFEEAKEKAIKEYTPILEAQQREEERKRILAETDPYVGMPAADVWGSKGSICDVSSVSVEIDGKEIEAKRYTFYIKYEGQVFKTKYVYCDENEVILIEDMTDGYEEWKAKVDEEIAEKKKREKEEEERRRRKAAQHSNSSQDYDVDDYTNFDEFYEDYWNDFIDIYEAEDYYYEHGGW